jgi:hypothetical protein
MSSTAPSEMPLQSLPFIDKHRIEIHSVVAAGPSVRDLLPVRRVSAPAPATETPSLSADAAVEQRAVGLPNSGTGDASASALGSGDQTPPQDEKSAAALQRSDSGTVGTTASKSSEELDKSVDKKGKPKVTRASIISKLRAKEIATSKVCHEKYDDLWKTVQAGMKAGEIPGVSAFEHARFLTDISKACSLGRWVLHVEGESGYPLPREARLAGFSPEESEASEAALSIIMQEFGQLAPVTDIAALAPAKKNFALLNAFTTASDLETMQRIVSLIESAFKPWKELTESINKNVKDLISTINKKMKKDEPSLKAAADKEKRSRKRNWRTQQL